MDNDLPPDIDPGHENETAEERATRTRREAVLIAEAEAGMEAGYWLDEQELDAWLRAVSRNENEPLPPRKDGPP